MKKCSKCFGPFQKIGVLPPADIDCHVLLEWDYADKVCEEACFWEEE